jgi:hypothetical protein
VEKQSSEKAAELTQELSKPSEDHLLSEDTIQEFILSEES